MISGIKLFYSSSGDAWNAADKVWSHVAASELSSDLDPASGLYLHTYVASIPAAANLEFFAYAENSELGSTNCSNIHSYDAASGKITLTGGFTMP